MKYCRKCVLPDTRPGLVFNADGVCSACAGQLEKKYSIDWEKRQRDFESIVAETQQRQRGYDCIVPVSGGKDSTWQVVKCLEYGLRILAVTWKTPGRTGLGQQNLDNLVRLGVDHIDYTINPVVERRFMYKTLARVGDTALPMHMALYAIPLRIAVSFNIPLVVWGESPHMEYGGAEDERKINSLDREWFKRHNILQGTSAEDWIGDDLSAKDLEAYFLPSDEAFRSARIRSIFLGYYFPWDPETSLRIALANGFQVRAEGPKVGYYNYADIDCDFISIHHYFKWLKFGFTRLFDNLSVEIRNERLTRDQAIEIFARMGDQTPHDDIRKLCEFLQITQEHFWAIAERFRNPKVWLRRNGKWVIEDFIIPNWQW
ncbi:MAG: N-acetyl sugar amidotransferase [Chloroflexi bacterium]|nr:N-acetyl sugar amidotransferase [Chloroflexota bacterium]